MHRFGTFLASAVLVSLSVFAAKAESFVLGAYPSNPPWEFKNEQGQFEGFEIDVAREIAKRIGRELEISDLGFQALFAATSSGRIDGAVSSISINNDRLQTQSFTQPYYDSDGTIVGREGSEISSFEDLKDKTIGVVAATTGAKWAEENREKYGIADITSYSAQQDLLLDVRNGRIDGGAGEIAGFQYAMTKTPGLKILLRIPTGERFAMMMKKNHPLLEQANAALTEMKKDGTMVTIHKKWFGVDPTDGTSTITPSDLPAAQ